MTTRRPLPAGLGRHFTAREARAVGIPPSRLQASDLDHPFHAVRTRVLVGSSDDGMLAMRDRMRAFAVRMTDHQFFVHAAALLALGVALPRTLQRSDDLPVGVRHPLRAPKGRGVAGVQIRPHLATLTIAAGLRVTDAATTWATLAPRLAHRDLVAVADALLRVDRMPASGRILREAHATITDLQSAVLRGRWPAVDRLRRAMPYVRAGVSSLPETHLRLAIIDGGLPEPELDVDVRDDSGIFLGCSELAYPSARVAVEYEGDHHRSDRAQWNRDLDKYDAYAGAGWTPVRISAAMLYPDPRPAVQRVGRALLRAGWRP